MNGQSSGLDLVAFGGSLTEALPFLPPSVIAWTRGRAPSLPVKAGASDAAPSAAVLELLLPMTAPRITSGLTHDYEGLQPDSCSFTSGRCHCQGLPLWESASLRIKSTQDVHHSC